jgi:hypothetical protein
MKIVSVTKNLDIVPAFGQGADVVVKDTTILCADESTAKKLTVATSGSFVYSSYCPPGFTGVTVEHVRDGALDTLSLVKKILGI